jgi:copper(I)-binding protein
MPIRRTFLLATACLAAIANVAAAHNYKIGSIEIGHPWSRATPPTAPTAGGFLKITNTGTTPDRLVSARSPAAKSIEIHEMKMDGNVMRMRALEGGLEIPAGATVTLAPGGYHLMMIGLTAPLKDDTKVPLTLTFEKAGSVDVELSVGPMGSMPKGH